jgi:hypothetical protein
MFRINGIGIAVLAAALTFSAAAGANCQLPAPPSHIPDGISASEQEMASAMRTLKQYNADIDDYNKCLEFEERQNRISREQLAEHHDNAVTTLASVVDRFNEQVRRYKARKS